MATPAFGDGRHKDHGDAIEQVSYLYKQLHSQSEVG